MHGGFFVPLVDHLSVCLFACCLVVACEGSMLSFRHQLRVCSWLLTCLSIHAVHGRFVLTHVVTWLLPHCLVVHLHIVHALVKGSVVVYEGRKPCFSCQFEARSCAIAGLFFHVSPSFMLAHSCLVIWFLPASCLLIHAWSLFADCLVGVPGHVAWSCN